MSEGDDGRDNKDWWSSWINTAKEKTSQTLQQVKHDLSEFTAVCSHDATALVSNTSEVLQHSLEGDGQATASSSVKKGITSLLGSITNVLTIPPESDSQDDILRVTSTGNFEVFDKAKARLFELQSSPQTYCTEPDGDPSDFLEWKKTFDLDTKKREISDLLVSVDQVRSIYTKLVPSAVSHSEFWHRYFYKVGELEKDEERKAKLKDRAEKLKVDHKADTWEADWDTDEIAQVPQPSNSPSLGSPPPADSVQTDRQSEVTSQPQSDELLVSHTPASGSHVESPPDAGKPSPDAKNEINEPRGGGEVSQLHEEDATEYVLVDLAQTTQAPPGEMVAGRDEMEEKLSQKSATGQTVGESKEQPNTAELSPDDWENWE